MRVRQTSKELNVKNILDFIFLRENDSAIASKLLSKYPKRRNELMELLGNDVSLSELLAMEALVSEIRHDIASKFYRAKEFVQRE
jgi:hypothetical protein